jgi:quinol monooxygenase YgiN
MKNLQITARFQIHNGQLIAFKRLAEECLSIVKAKDMATLQYDWYFDLAQTECVIRETYLDSMALLIGQTDRYSP